MKKVSLDLIKVILTAIGGILVALNVLDASLIDELIGAIMVILGAIWTVNAGQNAQKAQTELQAMKAGKVESKN
jgi:hypothetical protein